MTHVLRYLLIYGERKKKVEFSVDLNVENVEVEMLREHAKKLFNLPGVILQIWDKGFDDWVDLEDGDSTPSNSRIKVEVDKSLVVTKALPPTLLRSKTRDSRGIQQATPEVIHIVDSVSPAAQVTPVTVGTQRAPPRSLLHVEKAPMQHQAQSLGHVSTANRAPRDALHASGIPDIDKHRMPGSSQDHPKPTSQHLYPTSLQSSARIPHSTYSTDMGSSYQWRHSPKDSHMEGARYNATERGNHSPGVEHNRPLPTMSYFQEVSSNEKQVVEDSRGVGEPGDDGGGGFTNPVERHKDDRQWIFHYELPQFPGNIAKKLKMGLELNCSEQRSLMSAIYDSVTKHTFYPTTSDYNILTDKLLQEFPILRNQTSVNGNSACESWKQKLMHKFKNQRKRRDAENPEVQMRKRSYQARASLLNISSCMEDGGFEEEVQQIDEVEEVVIKDEDDSQQNDDCLFSEFHVMAADTTETGNKT